MNKNLIKFKAELETFKSRFMSQSQSSLKSSNDKYAYARVLIDISSGIAVGSFLGYMIDNYLGTIPLMLFILTIFGMIGGIYNVYKNL